MDSNLRFSAYLKECTSELFKEIVEVEPHTWWCILVLLAFARIYLMVPYKDIKLALFLAVGVVLLGITILARNKLLDVYMRMVRPGYRCDDVPYYVWKHRTSKVKP